MSVSLIFLVILVIIGFLALMSYNRLVALRQNVRQAFGDIDVQLKQRHDLVPNLVEIVKGYAQHESSTLQAVIAARNSAIGAQSPRDQAQAEGVLNGALRQVFALAENYPDLKANASFVRLQDQMQHLEDKLAAARRFFNNSASEFNTAREQFPAVLMANSLGFQPAEFFDLDEAERLRLDEAPQISLTAQDKPTSQTITRAE